MADKSYSIHGVQAFARSAFSYFSKKESKILFAAILISLIWHLFWINFITVVSPYKAVKQAKISAVSFLGPLLSHSNPIIGVSPREMSVLESRFSKIISTFKTMDNQEKGLSHSLAKEIGQASFDKGAVFNEKVDAALSGPKLQAQDNY